MDLTDDPSRLLPNSRTLTDFRFLSDRTVSIDAVDLPSSVSPMTVRRLARRIERCCCTGLTYFPLVFVYGLTTWAVWVQVNLVSRVSSSSSTTSSSSSSSSSSSTASSWIGPWCGYVAVFLYTMLTWCYTTAVFTSPGSTTNDQGYSTIPSSSSSVPFSSSVPSPTTHTVKSNGEHRFCKKCQARKPDRAHHCSTCRRCVLKMDHHCPWLANCIGLRNGKAFVLFLVYTTVYSLFAFALAGSWTLAEIASDSTTTYTTYDDSIMPIQYIVLSVIGGIIGLVLFFFTGWHLVLACRGQTTIECLESTRYQTALRGADRMGDDRVWLDQTDNNVRDMEEGLVEHGPTLGRRLSFHAMERYRAQKRHEQFLDDQDAQKLPHAFDLGVRGNLRHLFGPTPLLWAFPVRNTIGDGWSWPLSPKWVAARDALQLERERQRERERAAGWGWEEPEVPRKNVSNGVSNGVSNTQSSTLSNQRSSQPSRPSRYHQPLQPSPYTSSPYPPSPISPSKADRVLGRVPTNVSPPIHLQRLTTQGRPDPDAISDEGDSDDDSDDNKPLIHFVGKKDAMTKASAESKTKSKTEPKTEPKTESKTKSNPPRHPSPRWMPAPNGVVRSAATTSVENKAPTPHDDGGVD